MRYIVLLSSLMVLLGLALPAQAQPINVVTTTQDLQSIAQSVGGDLIHVESLGRGNQNYHFISAKPSFMMKLKRADLFIVNGLDLEIGYESLLLEGARNAAIQQGEIGYLDASGDIHPMDVPDHVDRSMGDIHAAGNPHYWLDPLNAKIIARSIADRLSKINPDQKKTFEQNLQAFNQKVDQKMKAWQKLLAPYKGEKIISYHQSWSYFAKRFGLEVVDQLEPKPGVPPTASHLQSIINVVNDKNINVILNENIYRTDAAHFVARQTQAVVVNAPVSVGGSKGARDYVSLMDAIIAELVKGFAS